MEFHRSQETQAAIGTVESEADEETLFLPSFAQERLWFMDQLEPDSSAYNLCLLLRMQGMLRLAALHYSLQAIVERHEILRTTFVPIEGRPMQAIASHLEVGLPLLDLTALEEEARTLQVQQLIAEKAERPFDLRQGPLVRSQVLRVTPTDHMLIVTLHHIAADGWSGEVLLRELNALYNAYIAGQEPTLPDLPIQYADYAVWQRQHLQGKVLEKHLGYWRQQLAGAPPLLELPTDFPRPAHASSRGAQHFSTLPARLLQQLTALSAREGVTLFMLLLAAFQTLLLRYTGQDDLVVGTPVACRTRLEVQHLIGLFANTLVLRTDLSGNPTFGQLLKRVREVCLDAYEHQELPFEKLVEELQPQRSLSYSPLFQVLFGLGNFSSHLPQFSGLTSVPIQAERATARFDLACDFLQEPEGLVGRLEYNTDLFEPATIARMATHLQTLLESIVAHPDGRLSELTLLGPAEQEQLLHAWNHPLLPSAEQHCLPDLFEAQVAQAPDAVALVYEDQHLTYAGLNQRANQLAHHLRQHGVGPECLVGLCLERSVELVIALLGVLKAGGAYVPLDPHYPAERLAFMAQDARLTMLLTQQPFLDQLPPCSCPILCLDADWESIAQQGTANLNRLSHPANLAYVLYTSGSTGQPKGVQVSQAALLNFLSSMQQQPGLTSKDTLMAVTSLSFDIAGLELYLPLLVGTRLEVVSRQAALDGAQLASLLAQRGATIMQATPATWRLLLANGWRPSIDFRVLCGGEALPTSLAAELQARGATVWNLYGPTETTIWSSAQRVSTDGALADIVPLGQPIAQTQFYVLDPAGQLVPLGVPGELFIGGANLARGYLHRPDLTAERFVPHPWSQSPGARLYRTGDRVRYRANGTLEYLGRLDFQVKLRGYRIELGEIEAVLAQQPGVAQAVVTLREETPGDQRLVAYIVPEPDTAHLLPADLRRAAQAHLPEYMIPAVIVSLASFPLTPNGKVDRRALPAPEWANESEGAVAPCNPTEARLADLWAQVLRLERVGIHDNFFALGGHSLLATQLLAQISETFQVSLPLRALFETPTVAGFAPLLEQQATGRPPDSAATSPLVRGVRYGGLVQKSTPSR